MKYYETLFLFNPNFPESDQGDIIGKYTGIVERHHGVMVRVDEWGKRTLAYPIKNHNQGYYVLMKYCGQGDVVEGLAKAFKVDEWILKHQTIKLAENADPDYLKEKEGKVQEEPAAPAENLENQSELEEEDHAEQG